jgi:tRNA (adenine22-N1)-methyltransferase
MGKRLELTPRLGAVADLVPRGARLADIGTDHAYLPVALLLEGRISSAIAADLRSGPLDRARLTAQTYRCTERLSFRLCDGLSGVKPGEADAVVIAGMGGETIAAILSAAEWVKENNLTVILQPMSSQPELRRWLCDHGYRITEERLAREGSTFYQILSVRAGESAPMTPAEEWAGQQSQGENAPLRGEFLAHLIKKAVRAMNGIARSKDGCVSLRYRELEQIKDGLLAMKEEWEAWQR